MKFNRLLFSFLYVIFIFIQLIDSLAISSLKREIRFSKFDIVSLNKTIITIKGVAFKQFYDKQMLFFHITVHKNISEMKPNFSVSKCKEHYVDCVNVVSYDIHDVCSKTHLLTDFVDLKSSNSRPVACPMFGEYNFKNISFEANKFGTMFSFPTEKWWESYWKFNIRISAQDGQEFLYGYSDFYIIEFRSRNYPRKN